jgi:hypothetical protein
MSISYAGTIALFRDNLIDETVLDTLLNLFVITSIIRITSHASIFFDTKILRLGLRLIHILIHIIFHFSKEFTHQ